MPRRSFSPEESQAREPGDFRRQVALLLGSAAVIRVGYLCLTTAVFGDAVSYARVAQGLAEGRPETVDSFWSSLYCYWEALFVCVGIGGVQGAIAASLLPGILLIVPVVWMARALYGSRAAWLAGAFCAVHPRLVEYACNGYAESFYLLAFTCGVAFMTAMMRNGALRVALGWGLAFGFYFTVRFEALAAFLLLLPLVYWARGSHRPEVEQPSLPKFLPIRCRDALLRIGLGVGAYALIACAYMLLSQATLGTPGLLQKGSNLSKQFSEQLDMRQAAKETYGAEGKLFGQNDLPPPSKTETLRVLARRFPRNLLYTLKRLPTVLLSPVFLFALLVPILAVRTRYARVEELPLLAMLVFPLGFYPLIQIEPRLLFPILIAIHVYGARGLIVACESVERRTGIRRSLPVLGGAIVALMLVITVWRGIDVERKYEIHRELSTWIQEHIDPSERLVGCGYGHIGTTAFLTGNDSAARIWTDRPETLADSVSERGGRWLVLYETFLRDANPELLPVLESEPPGLQRLFEAKNARGERAQVFELRRNS